MHDNKLKNIPSTTLQYLIKSIYTFGNTEMLQTPTHEIKLVPVVSKTSIQIQSKSGSP